MALSYVTIQEVTQDASGASLQGSATFQPSQTVYASGIPLLVPNVPVQAEIVNGTLLNSSGGPLRLLATDNANLSYGTLTGYFQWTVTLTISGQVQPSWSFFLPSSPSTVDLFSLAHTTAGGGGGGITPPAGDIGGTTTAPTVTGTHLASPLPIAQGGTGTTSGTAVNISDTLDQVPAPAANVSLASHKVTNLANGSAAQDAVAFGQIPTALPPNGSASGDLSGSYPAPTVAKVNGVAVTGTPSAGYVPTATGSTAATWQAPSGGYQAWQFLPETYGAKGDGQVVADVATTSGSGVITSASGRFAVGDVGKHIMINGGNGTATGPLITTIASYQSATQVTVAGTAGATATGCATFWATDDAPAFQSMCQAMQTYALANTYKAQAILGDKFYGLAALYQQTSPALYNTHVPVLYPAVNGTSQQLDLEFYGAGGNGSCQYWQATIPNLRGTCLVSMSQAPGTANATYGQQSVMGGPTGGGAFTGGFASTHVVTEGIMVVSPAFPDQIGFDFAYLAGWSWEECSAQTFQSVAGNSPKLPDMPGSGIFTSTIGIGFRAPLAGNNDAVTGHRLTVEGYETHGWVADHFVCDGLATIYADLAILIDTTHGTSGNLHGVVIKGWSCEAYNGALKCNGGGSGYCAVDIDLDTESGSGDPAYDVNDNGNLHGIIRVSDNGGRTSRTPVVANGAKNLKVINDMIGPGPWASAPAAPTSGTPQQNTSWRDATVYVSAVTSITNTATGPASGSLTSLGQTAGANSAIPIRVPSGQWFSVTYSGTLTAKWVLE